MKMWYLNTMEYYYSAVKKNKIINFTGKSMDLEKIILSEVIQSQKDKHAYMFSLNSGF